jgi:hypothetical protein
MLILGWVGGKLILLKYFIVHFIITIRCNSLFLGGLTMCAYKKKLPLFMMYVYSCFVFIIINPLPIKADWFESTFPGVGNLTLSAGIFYEIPQSDYVMLVSNYELLIVDIVNLRCRGSFTSDLHISNPVVLPDPKLGWNIYFNQNEQKWIGKIHVNESGEIGKVTWLPKTYEGLYALTFGVPARDEFWLIADKIYRMTASDESWTDLKYPPGWDTDQQVLNIITTDDKSTMFIISIGNTIQTYQCLMLNLLSFEMKILNEPSDRFFSDVTDIKAWNGNNGSFLILRDDSTLWTYNLNKNQIEMLMDGLDTSTEKIMQDSTGQYIYLYSKSTIATLGQELIVLDLIEKSKRIVILQLEQDWGFYPGTEIYDKVKNRIFIVIANRGDFKLVMIDLKTEELKYINFGDTQSIYYNSLMYLPVKDETLAIDNHIPVIKMVSLTSNENKSSGYMGMWVTDWSVTKGEDSTRLLKISKTPLFVRLIPDNRRILYDSKLDYSIMSHFSDDRSALLLLRASSPPNYTQKVTEYFYDENKTEDITISQNLTYLYPDPLNNQIIGFSIESSMICFIKHHGIYKTWNYPGNVNVVLTGFLPDLKSGVIWMVYSDADTSKSLFYKISTSSYDVIDQFEMPSLWIGKIRNLTFDKSNNFLYYINPKKEINNTNSRELVIIDIDNRAISNRFTLEINVPDNISVVYPGIIPIQEENKLFLWDHYNSWCIDLKTMNRIYGNIVINPRASYSSPEKIDGYYIDNGKHVIVYDPSSITTIIENNKKRVYEFDLETGTMIKEVGVPDYVSNVFLDSDNNEIWIIDTDKSKVLSLHLDPSWSEPTTITPSTNYIQFGTGDKAKFTVNIKNPYDILQKATAYIWLYAPGVDAPFFFTGSSLSTIPVGIPLTLPANLDVTGDILSFTMPSGLPEGFYNYNAVFINEHGDRGPIGTWNFYVKD